MSGPSTTEIVRQASVDAFTRNGGIEAPVRFTETDIEGFEVRAGLPVVELLKERCEAPARRRRAD